MKLEDRIAYAFDYAKQTQSIKSNRLAALIGVHPSQIKRYREGTNEPTISKLTQIAKVTGVNLSWLCTGQGVPLGNCYLQIPIYQDANQKQNNQPIQFNREFFKASFSVNPDNCVIFIQKGDMMKDFSIKDGAFVLVNQAINQGDGLFLIKVGPYVMVRKIVTLYNEIKILSGNKEFEPEPKSLPRDEVTLLGKVVWTASGI